LREGPEGVGVSESVSVFEFVFEGGRWLACAFRGSLPL